MKPVLLNINCKGKTFSLRRGDSIGLLTSVFPLSRKIFATIQKSFIPDSTYFNSKVTEETEVKCNSFSTYLGCSSTGAGGKRVLEYIGMEKCLERLLSKALPKCEKCKNRTEAFPWERLSIDKIQFPIVFLATSPLKHIRSHKEESLFRSIRDLRLEPPKKLSEISEDLEIVVFSKSVKTTDELDQLKDNFELNQFPVLDIYAFANLTSEGVKIGRYSRLPICINCHTPAKRVFLRDILNADAENKAIINNIEFVELLREPAKLYETFEKDKISCKALEAILQFKLDHIDLTRKLSSFTLKEKIIFEIARLYESKLDDIVYIFDDIIDLIDDKERKEAKEILLNLFNMGVVIFASSDRNLVESFNFNIVEDLKNPQQDIRLTTSQILEKSPKSFKNIHAEDLYNKQSVTHLNFVNELTAIYTSSREARLLGAEVKDLISIIDTEEELNPYRELEINNIKFSELLVLPFEKFMESFPENDLIWNFSDLSTRLQLGSMCIKDIPYVSVGSRLILNLIDELVRIKQSKCILTIVGALPGVEEYHKKIFRQLGVKLATNQENVV